MTIKISPSIETNEIIDTLIKSAILNFRDEVEEEAFQWDNYLYWYVGIPYNDNELLIVYSSAIGSSDEQCRVYYRYADVPLQDKFIDYELDIPEPEPCEPIEDGDFVFRLRVEPNGD